MLYLGKTPVKPGATITDTMFRQWRYVSCIAATPKTPAIITAKSASGKVSNMGLGMFPGYGVR